MAPYVGHSFAGSTYGVAKWVYDPIQGPPYRLLVVIVGIGSEALPPRGPGRIEPRAGTLIALSQAGGVIQRAKPLGRRRSTVRNCTSKRTTGCLRLWQMRSSLTSRQSQHLFHVE
jgi:hypothetical protein